MVRSLQPLSVFLLGMLLATAGCLTGDDGDDGDDGLPLEGTTEGFRMPDLALLVHDGSTTTLREVRADYIVVHMVSTSSEPFLPQFTQIDRVLHHFENVTVAAISIRDIEWYNGSTLADLRDEAGADWTFAMAEGIARQTLSVQSYPTIFILDPEQVILTRSDEALGQARMVQAIEATWGIEPPEDAFPQVNVTLPDLVWRDVNDREGSLAGLRGSPVLLNVWEMECPFCLELFRDLGRVHANYSDRGLEMVSIDLITWETEAQVRSVMEEHNATWTFAIDSDNIQGRYDIWRLPFLVLIDADGVVRWTWTGYVHHSVIAGEVEKLI